MGKKFIEPPPLDIGQCFRDSTPQTPLIFVLSTGCDPFSNFKRFAKEMSMEQKFFNISLGQGQGPRASKMVRDA